MDPRKPEAMAARQIRTTDVPGVSERPLVGVEGSPLYSCSRPRVQATPGEPRELGGWILGVPVASSSWSVGCFQGVTGQVSWGPSLLPVAWGLYPCPELVLAQWKLGLRGDRAPAASPLPIPHPVRDSSFCSRVDHEGILAPILGCASPPPCRWVPSALPWFWGNQSEFPTF